MITLAEFMIITGADSHPPMLEKSMYDSWKSCMEIYIENRENGIMILSSVLNGPLVWPTVAQEYGTTRTKKYEELSVFEKLQANYDLKDTNIVLQGLPPDVYAIVNHHKVAKDIWDRVKLLMQGTELSLQEKECLAVHVFTQGDDPIAYLNKAMAFLSAVAALRFPSTNNQLRTSSNLRNQATIQDDRVTEGRQGLLNVKIIKVKDIWLGNALSLRGQGTLHGLRTRQCWLKHMNPMEDLDAYDSDYDDVSNAKAVLMANLSNYGPNVISEANQENNNESLTAELERYKERVKTFEQRLNIDLSTREKMIDSQMDDMIKEKIALKQQIDLLEQNLSNLIKEKEYLLQTFTVFKNESKEKESKYMDKEINLEKKIKELDNIVYKVGQSAQTVHICYDCVMNSTIVFGDSVNLEMQSSESYDKCSDLDAELLKKQNAYNELSKSYSQLEKHCISLELTMQLNQEIFQKDKSCNNQNAFKIPEYFKNNYLKAQLQAKDTTIRKLKEHIKFMRENNKEEKVKHDIDEIETINIELEHSVAKLLFENEHLHKEINQLKQVYMDQFDSIKRTRVRSKEHCDSLISQLNSNFMENADLKGQIQEKGIVEQAKAKQPLDNALDFASNLVPPKEITSHSVETQKPEIKVYSRRSKQVKSVGSSKKSKIIKSRIANNSEPNHSRGSNAIDVPSSSSLINERYGDYHSGNVTISRVYYIEGLGHNLFSVGQFCDSDLKVSFLEKHLLFFNSENLDGVDLLSGSRDTNLYIISLDDMLKTSSICLLSKASKTKSWLWHRLLSYLNFGTLNKLAKDGLARGIPKLKFKKDHLCSACALGKSKKSSHQPNTEDTNQEKLYLLHMDLFKFLRTKDEALDAIIKCIKNIQVRLNATVCNVRTDNGTEFVN
ncbi:retrovirus-related pol polyprotein from transposon TNT 1-94 [Tanacetum coccineum]|uniref:Retrovirus-related pol polyprotein from transposon TNT 1-94 n=1 Tax=Tanacetum coccineum TaxID=301880 RepID=A0ABQ4XQ84_9ASTR